LPNKKAFQDFFAPEGFYSYLKNIKILLRAVLLNLGGNVKVDAHRPCPGKLPYRAHALRTCLSAGQTFLLVFSILTHQKTSVKSINPKLLLKKVSFVKDKSKNFSKFFTPFHLPKQSQPTN
jgi:hypothetical protein